MRLQPFLLVLISYILTRTESQPNCHSLCTCANSQCSECYETFQSNASKSVAVGDTCPCPTGFYSSGGMCKFCAANCKACASDVECLTCFDGYTKVGGGCVYVKYGGNVDWKVYQFGQDFKQGGNGLPSLYEYTLIPSADTSITYNACPSISDKSIVNFKTSASSSSSVLNIIRTFYGLPYHSWAHLSIKYLALDTWSGETLMAQFYMNRKIGNKTYSSSIRTADICGSNTPDNPDQFHSFIPHLQSTIAVNLTLPKNLTLSLASMKLDIGTCPRNCLSCSSPASCEVCKPYYKNNNGICQCNETLSWPTTFGCLEKCRAGYFYLPYFERCTLCVQIVTGCRVCMDSAMYIAQCQQCQNGKFLNNRQCLTWCPSGTFTKYYPIVTDVITSTTNVSHCMSCPTNCLQCHNQTTCIQCSSTNYIYRGQCISTCPPTSRIVGKKCFAQTNCTDGCLNCNASACIECQPGYWLNAGVCLTACPIYKYRGPTKTCLSCAANCQKCLDNSICLQCQTTHTLVKGNCVIFNNNCSQTGEYYDGRVRVCVDCPQNCLTCFRTLCYTCKNGYYLDNGACLSSCSTQKYHVSSTTNTSLNNICYWKSPICQISNTTGIDQCSQCRSMDYIIGLSQDGKCRTSCPANKTFSTRSSILTNNQRLCNVSCPNNCQVCIETTNCIRCVAGYYISGSNAASCVQVCQTGYFSDLIQCVKCPSRCSSCDSSGNCLSWSQNASNTSCPTNCLSCFSTVCVKCTNNTYLTDAGACASTCPDKYFIDNVGIICRKCLPECAFCSDFSKCSKCINGFYLNRQSCVRQCPNGLYINSQTGTCQSCSPNCKSCFGPHQYQCLSCNLNQVMDNTECIANCPVNKYLDPFGRCDWCHEACKYCYGPAQFQCLQCNNDRYLYRGECSYDCPASTYLAIPQRKQCKQCTISNCALCYTGTECLTCAAGFYKNNGICYANCPTGWYIATNLSCVACTIPNCVACSATQCYRCGQGYSLQNGTCYQGCPSGTFLLSSQGFIDCRKCPVQCLTCNSQYQCTTCASGLVLINNQCTKTCQSAKYFDPASSTCKTCNSIGCLKCTQWSCQQCSQNYYIYNGVCVSNCPASTYASPQSQQCIACPVGCKNCSQYYKCNMCDSGYNLVNQICVNGSNCSVNCQICASTAQCVICNLGYYTFVNSSGTYCTNNCSVGTYLSLETRCLPCPAQCISCVNPFQCKQCKTNLILFIGQCIPDCYLGYFVVTVNGNRQCQQCGTQCYKCISSPNNCTECRSTTAVLENGTCKEGVKCLKSQFFSPVVGYCMPCVQFCLICNNPYTCDKCYDNYVLTSKGLCQPNCQIGTYKPQFNYGQDICQQCQFPCLQCYQQNCQKCSQGYPLNTTSNRCQPNCNQMPGYFTNTQTNKCQPCNQNCLSCIFNASTCTGCKQGYYLVGTQCFLSCPDGTYLVEGLRECLPCSEYCEVCESGGNCTVCHTYYTNFNGRCLPQCLDGYYDSSGVCIKCREPCRECIGGSMYECESCLPGYYYFNGRCVTNCPDSYYRNNQTLSCMPCPTSCQTCTQFTTCQTCKSGFTYNTATKKCQTTPICPSTLPNCRNCITVSSVVKCGQCFPGFYVKDGICYEQCGTGFYENIATGKCESCELNCSICQAVGKCTECKNNTYLFEGTCYVQCPAGTYPMEETTETEVIRTCVVDPCVRYTTVVINNVEVKICKFCVPPFYLQENICVDNCSYGYYPSVLQCLPCLQDCQNCSSKTECSECSPTHYLYNSQCYPICPVSTYTYTNPDTGIQQCKSCNSTCLQCVSYIDCTRCLTGFFLASGQCVTKCPNGTYGAIGSGQCQRCVDNCQVCAAVLPCVQCKNGTYLLNGYCVTTCPNGKYPSGNKCLDCLQPCKTCQNSQTCQTCQPPYYINKLTFQCEKQCPTGTYPTTTQQCVACPSSCTSCVSANRCTVCKDPLVLLNGICLNSCPSGYYKDANRECRQCDALCKECLGAKDNCTVCFTGYYLANGYCKDSCPDNTFTNQNGVCQSCNTTYYQGKCKKCYGRGPSQCQQCNSPYYILSNICYQNCPPKYYPITTSAGIRQCLPCGSQCFNCSSSQTCTSCPWGYYLLNGKCLSVCPSGYYSNVNEGNYRCLPCVSPCAECISAVNCTKCVTSFYLALYGTCVANCSALSNQTVSYYLNQNNQTCQPCPQYCSACSSNLSTLNCSKCTLPYHLYLQQCVSECPISTFLDSNLNQCKPCSKTFCLICSSLWKCDACVPGRVLFNGECIEGCYKGYIAVDGKCVVNETNCTGIAVGSTCVDVCPQGYYLSGNTCLPCSMTCTTCFNSTTCYTCVEPYKLINSTCVIVCPSGYTDILSVCEKCSQNCQTCPGAVTQCSTCKDPLYLYKAQCISTCPQGYFPTTTTPKSCQPCLSKCRTCSNATSCTICENTRYSPPNCNDTSCPSNQYKNQATGSCSSCASGCLTCFGGSSDKCSSCQAPLVLIQSQCRNACPEGFVYVTGNNSCVQCPTGCKVCQPSTTAPICTQCFPPLILFQNKCLSTCSQVETVNQSYTTNGQTCYPCPTKCMDCVLIDASTGQTSCTICEAGNFLYLGECKSLCPDGFYPQQGTCQNCPQNCLKCTNTPNSCSSCTNNTYLYKGSCVTPCPPSTYQNSTSSTCVPCADIGCLKCPQNPNKCTECTFPNFPSVDSANVTSCSKCSTGYLYNTTTKSCMKCEGSCLSCNVNLDNCTGCPVGTVLVAGRCLEKCLDGYYQVNSTTNTSVRQCKPCPTNCSTCIPSPTNTSSLTCQKCTPPNYYYSTTNQCLPQCPSNTYITNQIQCTDCPSTCLNCTSLTSCGGCKAGYALYQGRCVDACPTGFYNASGICRECGVACLECIREGNCTKCRSDYSLNSGVCEEITDCPRGQYTDIDGSCKNCSTNCSQCISPTYCTYCVPPLYQSQGQCLPQCPSFQYPSTQLKSSITYRKCINCTSPCDQCTNRTQCTHCQPNYYLSVNKTCVADCGDGYYQYEDRTVTPYARDCKVCADRNCKSCNQNGCEECKTNYSLIGYIASNKSNGTCVTTCPSGYYKDASTLPLSCKQCTISNCQTCNSTACTKCQSPYILLTVLNTTSCVTQCPANMLVITVNQVQKCQNCKTNCAVCRTENWCTKCEPGYYLLGVKNLTKGVVVDYNSTCVNQCPETYYGVLDERITQNSTCENCSQYCKTCTNQSTCSECISESFILQNNKCTPYKCLNCTICQNEACQQCSQGFYLYNGACTETCPQTYFGNPQTKKCQSCMNHCVKCPNISICDECQTSFNFTGTECVDEAYIQYGSLSNMSGFTSNITEITTAVYLGTSVGPLVFGEMTTTYFNIEFCQFILFHARASGQNKQMDNFLNSLQGISLTVPSTGNTQTSRRLLLNSLADPLTFLVTNAPIFGLMGGFLLAYLLVYAIEHYAEGCCQSCPRFKFYVTEICFFMRQRFKWIYFDFVAWISFLPFLYFALMQLKAFSFGTFLEGLSCILSIVIIVVYPLYPFFIVKLLKDNYNDLVQQNNRIIQMSLTPYVYKVKRPQKQLVPDQPIKDYFTSDNLRLIYQPLKYLRKMAFIFTVALCPVPSTTLIILIIINLVFIGYMAVFRPRLMPYMVFDFIIEGILLFFEIFMLVYLLDDGARITAMSIAAHAIGFITANLSLVIAIILNLIAYYKIFMCLYELYKHLAEKLQEKEKGKLKDEQDHNEHLEDNQFSNHDLPEKDKDLQKSMIRKRGDDQMTQQNDSQINKQLIKDKQIFGDQDSKINDDSLRKSKGLPDLKSTTIRNKNNKKKQENMEDTNLVLIDDGKLKIKDKDKFRRDNDQNNIIVADGKIIKINESKYKRKEKQKERDQDNSQFGAQDHIIRIKDSVNKNNNKNKKKKQDDDDNSEFGAQDNIIVIKDSVIKHTNNNKKKNNDDEESEFGAEDNIIVIKDSVNKGKKDKEKTFKPTVSDSEIDVDGNIIVIKDSVNKTQNNKNKDTKQKQKKPTFKQTNSQDDSQFGAQDNIIVIKDSIKKSQTKQKQKQKQKQKKRQATQESQFGSEDQIVYIKQTKNNNKNNKKNAQDDSDSDDFVNGNIIAIKQSNFKQNKDKKKDQTLSFDDFVQGNIVQIKDIQKKYKRGDKIDDLNLKQRQNKSNKYKPAQVEGDIVDIRQQEKRKLKRGQDGRLMDVEGETVNIKERDKKKIKRGEDGKPIDVEGEDVIIREQDKRKIRRGEDGKMMDVEGEDVVIREQDKKKMRRGNDGKLLQAESNTQRIKQSDRNKNKKKDKRNSDEDSVQNWDDLQGCVVRIQQSNAPRSQRKRKNDDDQEFGEFVRGRIVKIKQEAEDKKTGVLGINENQQENYEQIRRKNKDNTFSPNKEKTGTMINSLNIDEFENSDYENRPESKVQRPGSKSKGILGINDNQSHDESDTNSVRQRRNSAIQKLRKKQGNLNVNQNSQYSQDDSVSSRPGKKQKKQRRKKEKSGILQIKNQQVDQKGIQKIQL